MIGYSWKSILSKALYTLHFKTRCILQIPKRSHILAPLISFEEVSEYFEKKFSTITSKKKEFLQFVDDNDESQATNTWYKLFDYHRPKLQWMKFQYGSKEYVHVRMGRSTAFQKHWLINGWQWKGNKIYMDKRNLSVYIYASPRDWAPATISRISWVTVAWRARL